MFMEEEANIIVSMAMVLNILEFAKKGWKKNVIGITKKTLIAMLSLEKPHYKNQIEEQIMVGQLSC